MDVNQIINLTVVILTKNEQSRIVPCLESVKWADEIIVVDDLSTDNTVELVSKYTDKIIAHKLDGYDKQRNIGIEQARGEWVLQLDADEIVSEQLREEILAVILGSSANTAYTIKRAHHFLGQYMKAKCWQEYQIKLFKKKLGKYEGGIHEQLKIKGEIGRLRSPLNHYPFRTISEYIIRQDRYTTMEAQQLFKSEPNIAIKRVKYNIYIKPIKLFWKNYLKHQGYKDGTIGFIFCFLASWRRFLLYAKYWEFSCQKNKHIENIEVV